MGITKTDEKRKTYSIDPSRARDLVRHSLNMSEELGRNVPRQNILDELINALKDKALYEKVKKAVAKLL